VLVGAVSRLVPALLDLVERTGGILAEVVVVRESAAIRRVRVKIGGRRRLRLRVLGSTGS